jgi:DNA-binding HxlR family transcriptional regulator
VSAAACSAADPGRRLEVARGEVDGVGGVDQRLAAQAVAGEGEQLLEPFVGDGEQDDVRIGTELIAHTWDPVVLMALRFGPQRRGELLVAIGGISDKVLAEALRRLLGSRLIARGDAYALTPLGASLVEGPLAALASWAVEHGEAVLAAQAA